MGKNPYPTVGVTLLSAAEGLAVWDDLPWSTKWRIATALDTDTREVRQRLRATLCPRSTSGCREVCVTFHSALAQLGRTHESRLAKTLFHIFRPDAAFTITGDGLRRLHAASGSESRWRVNVSDDVRWEYLAPGLFDLGVPGYAYTKWSPAERPGFPGFSVVCSATERTSVQSIVELVGNQHRAAIVFDVPAKELPEAWKGMKVVNGDRTDDLFEHEPGTIVGLSAKGPDLGYKVKMRESGFSRAA